MSPSPKDPVAWSELTRHRLEDMAAAGEMVLECYRVLQKSGANVVGEVLHGQGEFVELDHYPKGDVYDHETCSQYYYHSHRGGGEHGHFHAFLREKGMPRGVRPVRQPKAACMKERDDTLSHLMAISMNNAGYPTSLFTTNRWVTADNWYKADDVIAMLDCFDMDLAQPSWPVNIWITNMLRLFRPQIEILIHERDAAVEKWRKRGKKGSVYEDRGLDITSETPISVEKQVEKVEKALRRAAPEAG